MKALQVLTCLMFFGSLTATGQVKSDYDKTVDFTKYKTYCTQPWEGESASLINDFDKQRIVDALKAEFKARGMTEASCDEADVSLTGFVVLQDKTSTTAYTNYHGGMGYRHSAWGWGAGSSTTTYTESDYTEGTLVLDMYDNSTKDLAWQGIMTNTIKEKPEKREKSIPKNISKLMKKYPVKPMK